MKFNYYEVGVARHQAGETAKWVTWAVADRILGSWMEREPYPAKYLRYCSALLLSPKYVTRMVKGYRLYRDLRYVWSDSDNGQKAARFGYPWTPYHPRNLRLNGVTVRHFMVLAEAGRGLRWDEQLTDLKMCIVEGVSADGLREYLAGNGAVIDDEADFRVFESHVLYLKDNIGNIPEEGRVLLRPFLKWWSKWEQ